MASILYLTANFVKEKYLGQFTTRTTKGLREV